MAIDIGLTDQQRDGVGRILAALLADEYVLYTKTRNYHWNVVGPQFNDLHKFFEAQYEELDDVVDDVAERMRALGQPSPATLVEFKKLARVEEKPGEQPSARAMLATLLADHESVIKTLRGDLETAATQHRDAGTSDFLTGLMERHEKMAWMLRAFLEGERV
jgi:starvation-inducible DNA-binding protein